MTPLDDWEGNEMTDSGRALSLLREYNDYRRYTKHYQDQAAKHPMRDYKLNPERQRLLEALDQWCQRNGVDVHRWVYSRFKIGKWLYAPKFTVLKPSKRNEKKALAYYHSLEETPLYSQRTHQRVEQQAMADGRSWNPDVSLNHTVELRKQRYLRLDQAHLCLINMHSETYGYHPQSNVCVMCPRAYDCWAALQRSNPNVAALRSGLPMAVRPVLSNGDQ